VDLLFLSHRRTVVNKSLKSKVRWGRRINGIEKAVVFSEASAGVVKRAQGSANAGMVSEPNQLCCYPITAMNISGDKGQALQKSILSDQPPSLS